MNKTDFTITMLSVLTHFNFLRFHLCHISKLLYHSQLYICFLKAVYVNKIVHAHQLYLLGLLRENRYSGTAFVVEALYMHFIYTFDYFSFRHPGVGIFFNSTKIF